MGRPRNSNEENERSRNMFLKTFSSVKADSGAVGMGNCDEALDKALQHVPLQNVPNVPIYQDDANIPVPQPIKEDDILDDIDTVQTEQKQGGWEQIPQFPYVRRISGNLKGHTDLTQSFNKVFDHVPDSTHTHYGGQAYQPDLEKIDLAQVPIYQSQQQHQATPDIETGIVSNTDKSEGERPLQPQRTLSTNKSIISRIVGTDNKESTERYENSHKMFEKLFKEPVQTT